jgi:carbon monoxide dehydrogenase subunit G
MQLSHSFTVPGPVEQTWVRFQDIADIAQCFPGAQVTATEGDTFEGTVKVKLGPIALVYAGSGTFTEKDESGHRFVVEAKGRDKRGNGTAAATVTLTMAGAGPSTDVQVDTELTITGKPAQFGRGVMQDVSDKLLGQFVSCLEQRPGAASAAGVADADAGPASVPSGAAVAGGPTQDADSGPASVPAGAATGGGGAGAEAVGGEAAQPPPVDGTPQASGSGGRRAAPEAIDLGATVLPAVARAYWKQTVAGVLGIVLLIAVLRRLLR